MDVFLKLTDEEIIKSLECCSGEHCVDNCPLKKVDNCEGILCQNVLDLIRRLKGAECPTCHGTGRIGTTDWLTKNMTKKQIAKEKAKAIAEHEQYIKTEYASKIFEELKQKRNELWNTEKYTMFECWCKAEDKVKKKYTEEKE